MRPPIQLRHEFVEHIPEKLADEVVYISITYATAVHMCCCGCGHEIITPLTPTDWQLLFDGETISLYPSIGNWSLDCKSHYWVKQNQALWADELMREEILAGRAFDRRRKAAYFGKGSTSHTNTCRSVCHTGIWSRILGWLRRG